MKTPLPLPVTQAQIASLASYRDSFSFELSNGLTVNVRTKADEDAQAPWERADAHGPVSEWTSRDKRAGERVLNTDRSSKRFYDYAEAVRIAKRDGWGLHESDKAQLAAKLGRAPTRGEIVVAAVDRDFEFLRSWCADEWQYIGVIVTVEDTETGAQVGEDSLWGIESCENPGHGYYWHEVAAEMVNTLAASHEKEAAERAAWEARDVVTKD